MSELVVARRLIDENRNLLALKKCELICNTLIKASAD
jgi:hypothetical protein